VLEFAPAKLERVEGALGDLGKPLTSLGAAGVLAGVGLTLVEGTDRCGVAVLFDAAAVGEAEAIDVSSLRLLASAEAEPVVEIIVTDEPMARLLVERVLLPVICPETLEISQVRYQAAEPEVDAVVGESALGNETEDIFGGEDFTDGDDNLA
jgi:hypothetical protein